MQTVWQTHQTIRLRLGKSFFFFAHSQSGQGREAKKNTHTHFHLWETYAREHSLNVQRLAPTKKKKKKNWWPIIEWDLRRNGINRAGANRRKKKGIHTIFIHYQIGKAKCQNLGTLLESPPFKQNDKQTGEMLQSSGGV